MPEPQRLRYTTNLSPTLLEFIRLRASLLNGCEYCIGLHTHSLTKHHETPDRIAQVATWRTSTAYTHREQAAFAWTEVITNIQQGHAPQSAFDAARLHFTDVELTNLTLAIAGINAWNRMAIAFRAQHTSKPQQQDPEATDGDGGKVAED